MDTDIPPKKAGLQPNQDTSQESSSLRSSGNSSGDREANQASSEDLLLGTFNTQDCTKPGRFNEILEYCLRSKCDIVAVQETGHKLSDIVEEREHFNIHWATKGLAFFVKKKISEVKVSKCGGSDRIACCEFKFNGMRICYINVYAPAFSFTKPIAVARNFYTLLSEEYEKKKLYFNGPIIIGGDLNAVPYLALDGSLAPHIMPNVHMRANYANNHGHVLHSFLVGTNLFHLNSRYQEREKGSFLQGTDENGEIYTELDGFLSERLDLIQDVLIDERRPSDHSLVKSRWRIFKETERSRKESSTESLERLKRATADTYPRLAEILNNEISISDLTKEICFLEIDDSGSRSIIDVPDKISNPRKVEHNTDISRDQIQFGIEKLNTEIQSSSSGAEEGSENTDFMEKVGQSSDAEEENAKAAEYLENKQPTDVNDEELEEDGEGSKDEKSTDIDVDDQKAIDSVAIADQGSKNEKLTAQALENSEVEAPTTVAADGPKVEDSAMISIGEVQEEIEKLDIHSLSGSDGVEANDLKQGGEIVVTSLTKWFNEILSTESKTETVPTEWKNLASKLPPQTEHVPTFNKKVSCPSLLACLYASTLARRLAKSLRNYTTETLWHFRDNPEDVKALEQKKRESASILNCLVKKTNHKDELMYFAFVNYSDAFNTVKKNSVLKALEMAETPEYIQNAFTALLTIDEIEETGIHLGPVASPILLSTVLQMISRKCDEKNLKKVQFEHQLVLYGCTMHGMMFYLEHLAFISGQHGFELEKEKGVRLFKNQKITRDGSSFSFKRNTLLNENIVPLSDYTVSLHGSSSHRFIHFFGTWIDANEELSKQLYRNFHNTRRMLLTIKPQTETRENPVSFFQEAVLQCYFGNCESWNCENYFQLIHDHMSALAKLANVEIVVFSLHHCLAIHAAKRIRELYTSNSETRLNAFKGSFNITTGLPKTLVHLFMDFQGLQQTGRNWEACVAAEAKLFETAKNDGEQWNQFIAAMQGTGIRNFIINRRTT